MYEGYKIYGPYKRKDGRLHVIAVKGKIKKTISYPKYLMECSLNRYLNEYETIDHIDNNKDNNSLNNLQVLDRIEHTTNDAIRNKDVEVCCAFCGEKFIIKGNELHRRNRKDRGHTGYFCSKTCSGKYGALLQHNKIEKLKEVDNIKPEKFKLKIGGMV